MEIKSSDKDSFRLVYDSCYKTLVRICYHVVYDLDTAQELVQEAFERFYLKNMSFPSEDEARYWLIRVAKNLALNYVRRNKREGEMVEKVKHMPHAAQDDRDGEREVIDAENRREVRAAIEALPENLRMVIQLREFSGLDYKSIAKVLGISETNVKVRVFRARKKLEEALGSEDRDVY